MKKLDFIGIGASRSGTTWVWQQLRKHPQVCTPVVKEAGLLWSDEDFRRLIKEFDECPPDKFIGEIVPVYYKNTQSIISRIKSFFPKARLFLILRNPVDRLFTQYKAAQWENLPAPKIKFRKWCIENPGHVDSNKFIRWLPYWFHHFQDQFRLDFFDDLEKDSLSFIQNIYKHIGLDHKFEPPEYWVRRRMPYHDHYENHPLKMTAKDRHFAKQRLKDSILELESFLGRKTGWLS